jgi:hypothetical protein
VESAYFVTQLAAGAGARCARAFCLSLADEQRVGSFLLSTAARDSPTLAASVLWK